MAIDCNCDTCGSTIDNQQPTHCQSCIQEMSDKIATLEDHLGEARDTQANLESDLQQAGREIEDLQIELKNANELMGGG